MEADHACLLTPPGPGAIAVIRLSGPGVRPFLARYFSKPVAQERLVHGELRDSTGVVIDDPVVSLLNPHMAEMCLHGGGAIVRATLTLAERANFNLSPPLPVPLAGNEAIEREVLEFLPFVRTRLGFTALLNQPAAWRAARWTAADVERALADQSLHWLLQPPTVAIVGVPNAGKSTLANQLFGQTKSIVLDLPGTTRDQVEEYADVDGLPVLLVDTPGLRQTCDEIERVAIERSKATIAKADLLIFVFDPTQSLPSQTCLAANFQDSLVVCNKADLFAKGQTIAVEGLHIDAKSGQGVAQLRTAIRQRFFGDDWSVCAARVFTKRQRGFLADLADVNG